MKVYVVIHWEDCEYEEIEKIFSSKEKAEEYQKIARGKYHCPRYYTSQNGKVTYVIEDYSIVEYEAE